MQIKLVLETGEMFSGKSIGYVPEGEVLGEIVFNTSMTGYQEVFTDPSYCDQIVVMTYPLIGNYGINQDDYENLNPALKAIVVKEACDFPSNWRNQKSLQEFLIEHQKIGISEIDTRKLTRIIRDKGAMKAIIVKVDTRQELINELLKRPMPTDQIARVSCSNITHYPGAGGPRIVMMDFGYKKNILTSLIARGCDVIVVPYNTPYEEIVKYRPRGILLSNGPGDPKDVPEVLPVIRQLQNHYPLFAICMGHQLFALANGADTMKMKFGHRGGNHPVYNFETGKTYITSQNHGYTVSEESIASTELEITEINLNDKTIEGLKHKRLPAFSVQYHPEANPGPHDTHYLFNKFLNFISGDIHANK